MDVRTTVATLYRAGEPVTAMERLREATGCGIRDAKFITIHLTIFRAECHHCRTAIAAGEIAECGVCGALNLDWAGASDQSRVPPGLSKGFPALHVEMEVCPQCGTPLGNGVTRCWKPGCDFRLPTGTVAVSPKP